MDISTPAQDEHPVEAEPESDAKKTEYVKIRRWRPKGKPKARSQVERLVRKKRRERGMPTSSTDEVSSDEDEFGKELKQQGVVTLHRGHCRKVYLYPGNVAVKSDRHLCFEEAEAMRVAWDAHLPVPQLYGTETLPNGIKQIKMQYIEGTTLQNLRPDLSEAEKTSIVAQLRSILETMRSIPPPGFIGVCSGKEIRDTRIRFTYNAPACEDEEGFNKYLMSAIATHSPLPLREAAAKRLRTDHRIVFSHCDLAPRNIIVKDGKIAALNDWEEAGWYSEYWEYLKFFYRPSGVSKDWRDRVDEIFPQSYHEEVLDYMSTFQWQLD